MKVNSLARDYARHDVPNEYLDTWQELVNSLARVFDVPSALIMRVSREHIEVLVSSKTEGNPYHPGDTEHLNMGLYCEYVMAKNRLLEVPDARTDANWNTNPDIKLGMTCYLGLPLRWPSGDMFGTICVLDAQERTFSSDYKNLLQAFKQLIEKDFTIIEQNRELTEKARDLEHAYEDMEAFSWSVSHDLKAPARQVYNYSILLKQLLSGHSDTTVHSTLDSIMKLSKQMRALVDDLLQLSRVSRSSLKREVVDLTSLAQDVVQSLKKQNADISADITIDEGLLVKADPGQLRILLNNLMGNALKFSRHSPSPHVHIGSTQYQGRRQFFVRDNGIGFPQEKAEQVFQPFKRLVDESTYQGTGIGLAIAQKIISRHNGCIQAESSPGDGTTFYFTLD